MNRYNYINAKLTSLLIGLTIGSSILYTKCAYAGAQFGLRTKDVIEIILVIFGIPTIIEIITFIVYMIVRSRISLRIFVIVSVIYIPIISLLLGWLLSGFLWRIHSDDSVQILSYIVIVAGFLYASLFFIIKIINDCNKL